MSRIKAVLAHMEKFHYFCEIDRTVCAGCVGDKYLKRYIKKNAAHDECSYCGHKANQNIAIHLDDLMELIMDGINYEFTDAISELYFDHEEKKYWGDYLSSYDLVQDVIAPDIETVDRDNTVLLDDIHQCIDQEDWCNHDPYGPRKSEIDKRVWSVFSEQVKHSTRYMFYKVFLNNLNSEDYSYKQPYEVLANIGRYIRKLHLVKKVKGISFYRARKFDKGQKKSFNEVSELAAPKTEYAKYSNRMSPAGIPMFYGALEVKTALIEISDDKRRKATVAKFTPIEPLYLLDLCKVEIPSLFDPVSRTNRQAAYFLQEFIESITQSVNLSDTEHIEYVPSQVVTEYFRRVFQYRGKRIDGLLYKSSRCEGTCCCLFIENHECTEDANDKAKRLYMNKASLKVRMLNPYEPEKNDEHLAMTVF